VINKTPFRRFGEQQGVKFKNPDIPGFYSDWMNVQPFVCLTPTSV
jgi:hypothetical protein